MSELCSNPLRFCPHKWRNCAQNFFCKTCWQRTSKMRLNFTANSFVFGSTNRENAPKTFYIKHARRKRQNASELYSKQLWFWTHESRKCGQNFFCKPCETKTSKMHLNFTANSFVFRQIYRETAPRTFFCKSCRQRTSKMRLNFTANCFVFGPKIGKMHPQLFL